MAGTNKRGGGGGKDEAKSSVKVEGEKAVEKTDATVPVAPTKPSGEAKTPMPEAAVDHRRQIVGTDEPKGDAGR